MSVKNTFREITIKNAQKQMELVDSVLENAPILSLMPVQPTSSGLQHLYEELLDVEGPGLVDLDDELPEITSNTKIGTANMQLIGGKVKVGQDKVRQLGMTPQAYFAQKIGPALKESAMRTEKGMLYNHMRAFAINTRNEDKIAGAERNAISAGGSGSTNYSIISVRWEPGQFYGLYNPKGYGQGYMFNMELLYDGALGNIKVGDKEIPGYEMVVKADFGILTANPRNASTIVNIDVSDADPDNWSIPTSYQIDDMLHAIRANSGGSSMIYCHPKVKSTVFSKFKIDKVEMVLGDTDIRFMVDAWDGIPIITSWNFMEGDEAAVTFA
jgi:hypothetical protein